MFCEICNEEIKHSGKIENGKPYHTSCLNDLEVKKRKEDLAKLNEIEGADEYLMQYFKDNPSDAKRAATSKYFALVAVREKDSCNSGIVYWIEEGDTQEEFEDALKHRLIYNESDEYVYTLEYLIVDKKVIEEFDLGIKLTLK